MATAGLKAGLKLPEEPTRGKKGKGGSGKLPKLPKGEVYTRLESRDLKVLLGPKPAYPLLLDFSSPDFQLETADFLLNAPNVFKELDFTSNSLVDCSNSFEHLSKLKRLVIDRNALCDIQFKGLVSLVTLSLADNRLNYLNDMGDLRKLVNLNLSGNKLTAGFDQISKCKALRVLDLGHNNIDFALPQFWRSFRFLNTLPKLNWLSFEGNPCEESIPHFRAFMIHELPKLGYLDWKPVTREERAEASKLAAKGLWKDKNSLAEIRKAKAASVMLRMGSGSTIRPVIVVGPDRPHTTSVPSTGKGKMLEELINGLDDENSSSADGERMSRSDTLSGVVGEHSGEIQVTESKKANAQLDNILEFLDEKESASRPANPNESEALAGMETLLSSVPSPAEKRLSVPPAPREGKPGEENYLEMFYSMLNTPRDKEESASSVPTRLVQTGGTLRRLESTEERVQVPSIKVEAQDEVIFNLLDQIIEDKSAAPAAAPQPLLSARSSIRKSQIQDFADIENTLNALETKFADEEKQRQERIEAEQEKLKKLETQRLELLRKKEQEKRLTIMRQREEQALRMEQERKRYEEEIKALQEQQRRAQEEAERLRREMEEQKRLRILAEQKQIEQKEKEIEERRHAQHLSSEAVKAKDDTLLTTLQPFYCRYNELQIGQKLGLGAVGVTHRGILRSQQVSIKKYHCPTFSDYLIKKLQDEAPKLSLLKHANVAEFIALCVDTEICVVSEWIDGASLYGFLRNTGNPASAPEWILRVAQKIARAMEYLHSNGVIHGSLKSKNVLLDRYGEVKLVDYGFLAAKRSALSGSSALPSANSGNAYMAPEVLAGDQPTPASDVYSYGILLWELFTRDQPFGSLLPHQIADAVVHNQRPMVPICPFVFTKLMQACWHGTPSSRPTFQIIAKILSQSQEELLRYQPTSSRRDSAPATVQRSDEQDSVQRSRNTIKDKIVAVVERIIEMLESSNSQYQLKAVKALSEFVSDDGNREAIVQSRALSSLLQLCANADDILKEQALRSLSIISNDDYSVTKVAENGGLGVLAKIVGQESSPAVLLPALRSVVNLSRTLENKEAIGDQGIVASLVQLLGHHDDLLQMQALIALGTLLTFEGNQVHFYKAGGVQPLLKLLACPNPGIQLRVLEVLAVLTNNDKMELVIKKVGVLRKLAPLIQSKSPLLKLQALQSVAKFSSRPALRAEMEETGVVEALVNVFADPIWHDNREVLLHTAAALAFFVLDHNTEFTPGRLTYMVPFLVTGFTDVKVELVKCFARILQSEPRRREFLSLQGLPRLFQALASDATNDELQLHGLAALFALAKDGSAEILDAIGKAGIVEHMSEDTLTSNDEEVQRCSLQLFTVLSANRDLKNRFASSDAVAHLVGFLDSAHADMFESALLTLANLCDNEQCRKVIKDEEGLVPLLHSLDRVADNLLERVVWALSNFALDESCQREMIEVGLSAIVRLVSHPRLAIQSLSLKTLLLLIKNPENRRAIDLAGGREQLHHLTSSPNSTVAAAAAKALQLLQPGM